MGNTDVRGRGFALGGKTLVAKTVGGTRQKLFMIATVVTSLGKTHLMMDEAFDADKFIEFLVSLIRDVGKRVEAVPV